MAETKSEDDIEMKDFEKVSLLVDRAEGKSQPEKADVESQKKSKQMFRDVKDSYGVLKMVFAIFMAYATSDIFYSVLQRNFNMTIHQWMLVVGYVTCCLGFSLSKLIQVVPIRSLNCISSLAEKRIESFLWNVVKFGLPIVGYSYTSITLDYKGTKEFNRDFFWFFMLMILFASFLTLRKSSQPGVLCNRDQTEEWKGWMQIIFLSYHYFNASEVYNLVRVLIAAYVWMTGFGHFIYFRKRKTFDLIRVIRTLLRLNFLVIFTCLSTNNQYMLYYICPMHTFWFLVVYLVMFIGKSYNDSDSAIVVKLVITFVVITLLYEVPVIFTTLFTPFQFFLKFDKDKTKLHEWFFRTGLDHYATWTGMVSAFLLPKIQAWFNKVETYPMHREWMFKGPITAILLIMSTIWYQNIYIQDKIAYNATHPYYSMLPVLTFLWLRNLTPTLRSYHLNMFAVWGRVTLESYITQLHLLLTDNAHALLLIWPSYRYLTLVLGSLGFGIASKLLFDGTVVFTGLLTPPDNNKAMFNQFIKCAGFFFSLYLVAGLIRFMVTAL